jgi:hypothetical protein
MSQTLCCKAPVHVRAWIIYRVYDLSRANPAMLHSVKTWYRLPSWAVRTMGERLLWSSNAFLNLERRSLFRLGVLLSSVSETDRTDLRGLTRTEPKTNPVPIENGMPTRKNSSLDNPAHISSPNPTTTSVNDSVLFGVLVEFDAFVKHQAVNVIEKTIAPRTNIQNINIGDVNVPWMKDSGRLVWVVMKDSLWENC